MVENTIRKQTQMTLIRALIQTSGGKDNPTHNRTTQKTKYILEILVLIHGILS
jgi:hypothetical protein